jgi:hypothetical protein
MTDFLNREAMRVVERNDRGAVTYRKRYRLGDEVDVSHIEESHVENLRESGVLVSSKDDVTGRGGGQSPYPGSQVTGAATGEAADHSEIADEDDYGPENEQDSEQTDGEVVDEYSEMDYSELQTAAKSAGLNAGGSADDLRARLREHDAS